MVKRNRIRDDRASRVQRAPRARGGVSGGAILTGVVVAFGAVFLLSAIIGGVLAATSTVASNVSSTDVVNAGLAAGIAFVVAQLLAYLWGGYAAGRMARGAGLANGLLVPLVAILVAIVVGGIAAALGASAQLNLPFTNARLPVSDNYAIDWGVGLGIAAVVLMFVGGAVGGVLGSRWHTKLERRADEEVQGRHLTQRPEPAADRGEEPAASRSEPDAATERRVDQPRR